MKQFCPQCEKWYTTQESFCPKCGAQMISEEKYSQILGNIANNASNTKDNINSSLLMRDLNLLNQDDDLQKNQQFREIAGTPQSLPSPESEPTLSNSDNAVSNKLLEQLRNNTGITEEIEGNQKITKIPPEKEQLYLLMRISKDLHFIKNIFLAGLILSIVVAIVYYII